MYREPPSQSARKSIHCCATDFLWHIYGGCRCCRELFSHKIPFVNHLSLCRRLPENENHITTCNILQHRTRHQNPMSSCSTCAKTLFHFNLTSSSLLDWHCHHRFGFSVVIALHRKNRAYVWVCMLRVAHIFWFDIDIWPFSGHTPYTVHRT